MVKDQDIQLNEWPCNALSVDSVSCTQKVTVVRYFQEELRCRNEDISKTYLEDISKGEVTTPYQASLNIVQFKTFQS